MDIALLGTPAGKGTRDWMAEQRHQHQQEIIQRILKTRHIHYILSRVADGRRYP